MNIESGTEFLRMNSGNHLILHLKRVSACNNTRKVNTSFIMCFIIVEGKMTVSYAKNLTPSAHEVHVLMNSCELKVSLKTVLRETIPFPDSKSLVGKVQRNRW